MTDDFLAFIAVKIIQIMYPTNTTSRMTPSIWPITILVYPNSSSSPAHMMDSGNSFCSVSAWTGSLLKSAQTPHTIIRLKMLDPTTLLIASVLLPLTAAVTLTAHSGRLVPMATIVSPIIIGGTLSIFATEELPSTKKSAPFISRMNPTIRTKIDTNIFSIKTPFRCMHLI